MTRVTDGEALHKALDENPGYRHRHAALAALIDAAVVHLKEESQ